MLIEFCKMHGAGNDFVLVDDREQLFPWQDRAWLATLGARRTGIGCEGFILVQPATDADFRMRFFNPDGGEAEMCGNGARCVARFAHDLGAAPAHMRIATCAGPVMADVLGADVRLALPPPTAWQPDLTLLLAGGPVPCAAVNSGVPHVMVMVNDLDHVDVAAMGREIRWHKHFQPAGTNVNFITVTGPRAMRIRTYERGVEAESGACGTGMVACALLGARQGLVTPPVALTCAGGDTLEVDFKLTADGATGVTLRGPAAYVYRGTVDYRP